MKIVNSRDRNTTYHITDIRLNPIVVEALIFLGFIFVSARLVFIAATIIHIFMTSKHSIPLKIVTLT